MRWGGALIAGALAMLGAAVVAAPAAPAPAARFDAAGHLLFPAGYRSWTFLTSGHGMNYNAAPQPAAEPAFDNVFVDPAAHAAFLATGHWPEGTMLVLEVRGGASKGSINLHGAYQQGAPLAIEVHVRDKRFTGGWGFFSFEGEKPATLIPYSATCYACHQQHAAVDTTFVQFYPTLLPVAAAKKSFDAAYLAEEAKR